MIQIPECPRFAWPFTILEAGDEIRLVAGEDLRYALRTGSATGRLALLLRRVDGVTPASGLLSDVEIGDRDLAVRLLERLASERILVAGPPQRFTSPVMGVPRIDGDRSLADALRSGMEATSGPQTPPSDAATPRVLCQRTLDLHAALEFNRNCLGSGTVAWLWVTLGPLARGYVSPILHGRGGPCLECLLRRFQRLSPLSALYDELVRHGQAAGRFEDVDPPESLTTIVAAVARWKLLELRHPGPPSAIYRLHVIEGATHEVSLHPVHRDPNCPACSDAGLD